MPRRKSSGSRHAARVERVMKDKMSAAEGVGQAYDALTQLREEREAKLAELAARYDDRIAAKLTAYAESYEDAKRDPLVAAMLSEMELPTPAKAGYRKPRAADSSASPAGTDATAASEGEASTGANSGTSAA